MKRLLPSAAVILALAICTFLTIPQPTRADDQKPVEDQKTQDIRHLLEVSGSASMGPQVIHQMLAQFRQMPGVPPEFWDEFEKSIDPNEFVQMMIPIYAKHFDGDEIKELIKFYESPIGKKLVAEQQGIMTESMAVGQQWGQQIAQRVMAKLQEKGIKPNQ